MLERRVLGPEQVREGLCGLELTDAFADFVVDEAAHSPSVISTAALASPSA